jgi:hypothetical protein
MNFPPERSTEERVVGTRLRTGDEGMKSRLKEIHRHAGSLDWREGQIYWEVGIAGININARLRDLHRRRWQKGEIAGHFIG